MMQTPAADDFSSPGREKKTCLYESLHWFLMYRAVAAFKIKNTGLSAKDGRFSLLSEYLLAYRR